MMPLFHGKGSPSHQSSTHLLRRCRTANKLAAAVQGVSRHRHDVTVTAKQALALAEYNRWMNERVYDTCGRLTDSERKKDHGAFFHSIHGTLNHLLLADHIWMGRFQGEPFQASSLDQELYSAFSELEEARERMDMAIIAWSETLTDDSLLELFRYTTFVSPGPKVCLLWVAVTHFFNHQTHHRGQLTTMLSQLGVEYGATDFLWLPGLVSDESG
jgi:uncharacterized damage-inducible protein DinB